MSLELKNNSEIKSEKNNDINFKFNNVRKTFNLSLKYILDTKAKIKNILKEECMKNNIILQEENIVLYDFENDVFINEINDLINNKTKSCTIIIIPIECNKHC